ncbi:S8 family peptidase [Brevibacillus sp. H7]|uniref:S8 family peptidase n=1 Tax=Brevibacillus sp. H7 TaxID=3349138 RepID=UPI003814E488
MQKLITFPSKKAFSFCLDCLKKNELLKLNTRQCGALRTVIVPEDDVEEFRKLIGKNKYQVSENVQVRLHRTDEVPWGVERVGAPNYWNQTQGQGIKVAVIDTGISSRHPDLRGQVKGRLVTANEGMGYAQMEGHGTHVAGTIAAVANKKGIVGVAPAVELYDIRAFGPDGTASIADIVEGINWAVENGMHIINMSFGTSENNYAMQNAIKQAARAGIIMVASAGNNGGALEYPAAYKEVVAVGAIDKENKLASFSSRGRGMNVVAPGVGIKSTWTNGTYRVLDGTSMAAAHISGLYALMLANQNKGRGRQILRGYGRVFKNAGRAPS